jgi:hypothetical protein
MRKTACSVAAAVLVVVTATLTLRFLSAEPISAQNDVSERTAKVLQAKIDAIQAAEKAGTRKARQTVEVSEPELESYVLYGMKDDIPARVESIDVQLTEGHVAADARLTFPPDATGNVLVDAFVSGTHTFFLKGKLSAVAKRGRFELAEVKVDGIPVPNILIETLVAKYVKPKYPHVDLSEPFPMPWGMESLSIGPRKATVTY